MTSYSNAMMITHRHKGIPYGGDGHAREDGDANFGFRYLKDNAIRLREIPELAKDAALCQLAIAINGLQTGLFTIGSASGPVHDEHGHRDSGYIEFAINSRSAIADAQSYFPIYFHFDRYLHESAFSAPTAFIWELQPATFIECDDATGFTCSIILNTHYSASREEAAHVWAESLDALAHYLQSVPPARQDFLYPQ
jgi:hypothetical protein